MRTLGWDGTEYAYMTVHGYKTVLGRGVPRARLGAVFFGYSALLKESCDFLR